MLTKVRGLVLCLWYTLELCQCVCKQYIFGTKAKVCGFTHTTLSVSIWLFGADLCPVNAIVSYRKPIVFILASDNIKVMQFDYLCVFDKQFQRACPFDWKSNKSTNTSV